MAGFVYYLNYFKTCILSNKISLFINVEYVKDLQQSKRMAEERKDCRMRKYIQIWKTNAQQKAELRECENAQKVRNLYPSKYRTLYLIEIWLLRRQHDVNVILTFFNL